MINYLRKIRNKLRSVLFRSKPGTRSYSQCGEDVIIRHALAQMGVYQPNYIDIGAHHPSFLNNTYLFYLTGARGVNIEPDVELYQRFTKTRQKDINLNLGVSFDDKEGKQDFYVMSVRTLNTFSQSEAERIQAYGNVKIETIRQVRTLPVNQILEEYFSDRKIDLLTIDTEGLDHEILNTIDFDRYRPLILCVETLSYSEDGTEQKNEPLISFLKTKGYRVYADTYINTIFINENTTSNL